MTNILELLKNEKVEWQKLKDILISINTGLNPRKNFVLNDRGRILTSWYITTKDYSQNEKIETIRFCPSIKYYGKCWMFQIRWR